MPVSRLADLPIGGDGRWPLCGSGFRSARWGDMEVGYTTTGVGDHTALYEGLPGGVCPCPHYGYVFTGRIRCRFPGSNLPDEVAASGEAYFFPAGHVLIYEEENRSARAQPGLSAKDTDGPHRVGGARVCRGGRVVLVRACAAP